VKEKNYGRHSGTWQCFLDLDRDGWSPTGPNLCHY